jgi:hypothetical protein
MIKKLSILLVAVMLIPAFVNAQEQTYMRPDGKFYKSNKVPTSYEVMKMKHLPKETFNSNTMPAGPLAGVNGLLDTLFYPRPATGNSNFGVFGQDSYLQWFKAPAELIIKGFAFLSTDDAGVANGAIFEGKIVSVNMPEDSLFAQPVHWDGYYEATGNGYNNITAFLDNADRTGPWVSKSGQMEPFGADIWSDGGFGAPITPLPAGGTVYQWINTNILFEPTVQGDEIFGIVYKNTGATMDVDRLGVLAVNDPTYTIYPAWKFYANGRLVPGEDYGWWNREFFWDFLVAVDIIGNTPPDINSFTQVSSGLSTGPFTVDADITDANPGNPSQAGVASATLYWKLEEGTTFNAVPMTGSEPSFTASIPAQTATNVTVEYYIEATDITALTKVSETKKFRIFEPTTATTLVVLNGYTSITGYPQDYLFGSEIKGGGIYFEHDTWAYGPLTLDLLNNYDNLIEICNGAPQDYNDDAVRPWLAADGTRNYYLEGQEWLGARYSYTDMAFVAGDFEFDILGINYVYNDVSYDGTVGQLLPSKLTPQATTLFGQPLLDKFATYVPTPDSIQYDPAYEGNTGDNNWIDGFNVESDVVVDVVNETRGIAGAPAVDTLNCAAHRVLTAGNKIFFASYWTYAVNTTVTNYHWLGVANESPAYQALLWFGIPILVTDVVQVGSGVPEVYSLSQNYPNPFNPSTTINFAIPTASKVVLKIYDVLGREVATLLNGEKAAGNYQVDFDASKLASGLYVYSINAGNFTSTKKMMLMK